MERPGRHTWTYTHKGLRARGFHLCATHASELMVASDPSPRGDYPAYLQTNCGWVTDAASAGSNRCSRRSQQECRRKSTRCDTNSTSRKGTHHVDAASEGSSMTAHSDRAPDATDAAVAAPSTQRQWTQQQHTRPQVHHHHHHHST